MTDTQQVQKTSFSRRKQSRQDKLTWRSNQAVVTALADRDEMAAARNRVQAENESLARETFKMAGTITILSKRVVELEKGEERQLLLAKLETANGKVGTLTTERDGLLGQVKERDTKITELFEAIKEQLNKREADVAEYKDKLVGLHNQIMDLAGEKETIRKRLISPLVIALAAPGDGAAFVELVRGLLTELGYT